MKCTSVISCLLLLVQFTQAQDNTIGLQVAPSYSFIVQSSDFGTVGLFEESDVYGLNFGGYYHLNQDKFSLRNSFDFQLKNLRFEKGFKTTDINGNNTGAYNNDQINLNSVLSSILTYNGEKGVFVGVGFSANFLLTSYIRTNQIIIQGVLTDVEYFRNYQYSFVTFAVPFVIGHDWKYSNIYLKLSFDFTNRLPRESLIMQRENMIQIGYGFLLFRD